MKNKPTLTPEDISTSQNLKRQIRDILRISLIVGGSLLAAQSGMADTTNDRGTTNLPPVDAIPPPYVPPYTPPMDPPSVPGIGGYDPGEGGGGGGSSSPPPADTLKQRVCAEHIARKPASCPARIPFPSGASYAKDRLPGASWGAKSTVLMAISFSEGRTHGFGRTVPPDPNAQASMKDALERQTQNYANLTKDFNSATGEFRYAVMHACEQQLQASSATRAGINITIPESYCLGILKAIDDEVGAPGLVETFVEWARRYGVPVEEYITPQGAGAVELEKSLKEKWKFVSEDAQCSTWWTQLDQQQCSIP